MDNETLFESIDALFDSTAYALLYLTIAVIAAVLIVGALVYFLKREKFGDFKKYTVGIAAGFAVCAVTLMAYLKFQTIKADPDVDMQSYKLLFYPILAEIIIAVAGGIAVLICSLFNKKATKIATVVTALGLLGGFIAIMVEMSKYYGAIADWYPNANLTGMIVSAVVFMALIAVFYFIGDKRNISDTRSIVYGAIAIAMSFALSYIRFFKMPQGGSVTFASLLPLMVYCCMFGTRRGLIACLIYGTLQAVQDPWIIHPMQFLLDYPLAFGVIGISGIFMEKGVFKNKKVLAFLLGGIIAVLLRFACHVLSGVFAFADYADLEKYSSAIVYSLAYNSFVFIDMLIALVAGATLFASKSFSAQMVKSSDLNKEEKKESAIVNDDDDEIDLAIIASQESERHNNCDCTDCEEDNRNCDECDRLCDGDSEPDEKEE